MDCPSPLQSFCPSVLLPVQAFSWNEMTSSILNFSVVLEILNFSVVAEQDFLRKRFYPINLENRSKIGFSEFIEKFWVTLGIP